MSLTFHADTHTYVADGRIVPSVSEIFAPIEDFSKVNPATLRQAAMRGTLVHEYAELIDYGEEIYGFEVETELKGYVEAYARFLRDFSPQWTAIEKPLWSEEHGFAGTIDRLGIIDGKETLVDIKTSSSVTPRTKIIWAAKLHAYSLLLGKEVSAWNLLLMPNGMYRIYRADETRTRYKVDTAALFRHLHSINQLLQEV